ncbi:hypothetical protein N0S44_000108 [Escherichia coli]|nr:hypothetical protein [Escherichia coli]EJR1978958.1 hypothetical protein [Escherichia coli]UTS53927.1 hypothetical protein UES1_560 [Escherichia phage UE-S1]
MSNIYKRIGEVLEGNGIINSVLAYDNNEEMVLIGAGFTRTGSVEVDGEIADIYTIVKKRNVVFVDDVYTLKDLANLRNKIGMSSTIDKPYLKRWNTKF